VKLLSGKDLIKLLEANGWKLLRSRGSHHVFEKDGRDNHVTVPLHSNKPLKKGTLSKILKDVGLWGRV
jgi:predicted RNA binding protein YcfA (HicA-like mRNA interferase family)